MRKEKYRLIYPKKIVYNPILFNVSITCKVSPSILKADITGERGEILVIFEGKASDIKKALSMLEEEGVTVEAI